MVDPIPLRRSTDKIENSSLPIGDGAGDDLNAVVGRNLKRLRTGRSYSLEHFAKLSGVSRAMLSQVELGRSVPTINVVFKIARAFGVPFSALLAAPDAHKARILRARESKILASASGAFSTRALFPFDAGRKTEFYELRLAAGGTEEADPHPPGAMENLVVARGRLEIESGDVRYQLGPNDAILFQADLPHSYRNLSDEEAVIYLVMTYVDSPGR
jgi:transcriptional regulator with XRE-family HTH domain